MSNEDSCFYGDYGIVKDYGSKVVWFEPVTDEIDAFTVRNKDGSIVAIYYTDN